MTTSGQAGQITSWGACALFAILALSERPAAAQTQMQYPPGVIARGVALTAACRAAGGTVINGPRPFLIVQHDLTGDGRREFILDEAAFACSSAGYRAASPAGAPVEVFDGASGTSLYRGVAAGWQVLLGARPLMMLTLRGDVCSPNALATTTCQRPLVWNAQARTLTGPQGPLNRPAGAAAAPPQAAPSPPAAPGSMTLTEADKAAAFRALGFKQVGRLWKRCEEETPTLSFRPGEIEEVLDLNGDGRPEAVIIESSLFCHGQEGAWFGIASKEATGAWRQVLETDGVFVALATRANGWREVMAGGPGFTHPVLRYNGRQYVWHRDQRE